jgi:CIC family chloride channel protein
LEFSTNSSSSEAGYFVTLIGRLKESVKSSSSKWKSFRFAHAGKWTFYFVLIGLIAGLGSIVFHYLCQLGLHYFMDFAAGFRPPSPAGEHHLLQPTNS